MKFKIENLGVLRHAEFELADLTLICGDNNSGKTYAAYALFGFFSTWKEVLSIDIPDSTIDALLKNGVVRLDVASYAKQLQAALWEGNRAYTQILPRRVFSSNPSRFSNTAFRVNLDGRAFSLARDRSFRLRMGSEDNTILTLTKDEGDEALVTSLLTGKNEIPPVDTLRYVISFALIDLLLDKVLPRPFIASAERTGVAMFRSELISARSKRRKFDDDPYQKELFYNERLDYPLPVEVNIEFFRRIDQTTKEDSFIATHHKDILTEFADIIGGEYVVAESDTIHFHPANQGPPLTMDESSSAVRSLLVIGLYLRHVAKRGDLLIIDEPELNLHPTNQRRLARLFARLVNLGICVFATTHSDYIVKELNTLIMLNADEPHLRRLARKTGYHRQELLKPSQLRVYIAEPSETSHRGVPDYTLVRAPIDVTQGIEARSFDNTINEMNDIQEAIIWGDDG